MCGPTKQSMFSRYLWYVVVESLKKRQDIPHSLTHINHHITLHNLQTQTPIVVQRCLIFNVMKEARSHPRSRVWNFASHIRTFYFTTEDNVSVYGIRELPRYFRAHKDVEHFATPTRKRGQTFLAEPQIVPHSTNRPHLSLRTL